jgi:hypothetical protein
LGKIFRVSDWKMFPRFGMLHQEKSGNPDVCKGVLTNMTRDQCCIICLSKKCFLLDTLPNDAKIES